MDEAVLLAGTFAMALINAMTSDAYYTVRGFVVRLFARGDQDVEQSVAAGLDEAAEVLVSRAATSTDLAVRLQEDWAVRILNFLRANPDAAGQLIDLVAKMRLSAGAGAGSRVEGAGDDARPHVQASMPEPAILHAPRATGSPGVARLAMVGSRASQKRCKRCGKVKPGSQFGESGRTADGLTKLCKPCWDADRRERSA